MKSVEHHSKEHHYCFHFYFYRLWSILKIPFCICGVNHRFCCLVLGFFKCSRGRKSAHLCKSWLDLPLQYYSITVSMMEMLNFDGHFEKDILTVKYLRLMILESLATGEKPCRRCLIECWKNSNSCGFQLLLLVGSALFCGLENFVEKSRSPSTFLLYLDRKKLPRYVILAPQADKQTASDWKLREHYWAEIELPLL